MAYEVHTAVDQVSPNVYEELNADFSTPADYYNTHDTDATTPRQTTQEFQLEKSRGPVGIFSRSRLITFILGILLVAAVTAIVLFLILYLNKGNYYLLLTK